MTNYDNLKIRIYFLASQIIFSMIVIQYIRVRKFLVALCP
jgi:hypothetical protein